jgi:hypothetical protein
MTRCSKRKIESVKLQGEVARVTHSVLDIDMDTSKSDSPLNPHGCVDNQQDPDGRQPLKEVQRHVAIGYDSRI